MNRFVPGEHSRPARSRDLVPRLGAGSGAAHAVQQPRQRSGGGSEEPGGVRRARQGGAQLGRVPRHHAHVARLEDDETLLVQSGKPVAVFPTHPGAPRVLDRQFAAGSEVGHVGTLLGAGGEGPRDVRADDGGELDVHRHAGNPAGHLRDLRRVRARRNSKLAGGTPRAHGRPRRHGRRPAALGDHERRRRACVEVDPSRIQKRLETRYLDVAATTSTTRLRARRRRSARRSRSRSDCSEMPPTCFPSYSRAGSRSTSSPIRPRRTIRSTGTFRKDSTSRRPRSCARAIPRVTLRARWHRW